MEGKTEEAMAENTMSEKAGNNTKAPYKAPKSNNKKQVENIQLETRKNLIEQLIKYRKAKKITQADISDSTGIQRPNISRLESGKYNPTLDMIVRVADSIGLEVESTLKEKNN